MRFGRELITFIIVWPVLTSNRGNAACFGGINISQDQHYPGDSLASIYSNGLFKISTDELKEKACHIRRELVDLVYSAGSGHLDTSLSLVEVWLAIVYSDFFLVDPNNGAWEGRDRVFLSEGHACPLQYLVNADLGFYPAQSVFEGIRKPFTPFQGHTLRNLRFGFENSNGSLGIGLWQAYGHALEIPQRVFCIAGDGEFQEPVSIGLFSVAHYLKPAGNYILVLNRNGLAQDSAVDLGRLADVAACYGWQTLETDGHDFESIGKALHDAAADAKRPSLIVCNTIKGYGGDPLRAGKLGSHGRPPKTEEEYKAYIAGVESTRRK